MPQIQIEKVLEENKFLKEENRVLKRIISEAEIDKIHYLMHTLQQALKALKLGRYYAREQLGI